MQSRIQMKALACAMVTLNLLPGWSRAETLIAPDIHFSGDYDSNKRLQLDNDDAVSGYVTEANLSVESQSPQWSNDLKIQIVSRHYGGNYDLGSDDQNVDASLGYQRQTSKTSVNISAINDTTLTDQRDFSGYTEEVKRRRYYSAGMDHAWQITPVDEWRLEYQTSSARYIDAENTNLIDYGFDNASTSIQHQLSEVFAGYLTAGMGGYQATDVDNESDSRDFGSGVLWKPSELSLLKLGAGKRKTRYHYYSDLVQLDDAFNYATIEVVRTLSSGKLSFKTEDLSQPTGDGNLYRVQRASLDYFTDLTQRLTLSLSAAYSQQRASAERFSASDRDNAQITASCRYRLTRDVGVQTVVSYRDQKYLEADATAASNSLWLGVYWSPVPYRW